MSSPKVHTFHCSFCSHLLLATTYDLASLPRRRAPALDKAIVLPLPPPPASEDDDGSGDEMEDVRGPGGEAKKAPMRDITLLLCTKDTKARIIEREDGFDKRFLWKCGRCKVCVGYQLDDVHFEDLAAQAAASGEEAVKGSDVIYILPGALVLTENLDTAKPVPSILDDRK